jgi:hypothetical protein
LGNHWQLGQLPDAVRDLVTQPMRPMRSIGFITPEDKPGKRASTKAKATGKKT